MAEIARTGTFYSGLSSGMSGFSQARMSVGNVRTMIEKIKEQLKLKEEERAKRMMMLKALMPFARKMDANRARTDAFKQGAELLGIALPKESFMQKTGNFMGLTTPNMSQTYGPENITGAGLERVGMMKQVAPFMGKEDLGKIGSYYSPYKDLEEKPIEQYLDFLK